LDSCVSNYKNLFSSSVVLTTKIKDRLVEIDPEPFGWRPSTDELDIQRSGIP
jgi:hypothetical protein